MSTDLLAPSEPALPLADVALSAATRATIAAAVLDAVETAFGTGAGIALDVSWGVARRGPTPCSSFPVGRHGSLLVQEDTDAAAFAASLAARLDDFEALEQERQRAERLASLYEAAQEFSAELDLDRTLEMIVQRGRALTGAEICYLATIDAAGDAYIRVTAGARTDSFRGLRLGSGLGLGGLVAKEGRPYYSSDYLHDERFVHVVDAEVAAEGVVSVLGVPLKLKERVVGVLFIGNRYPSTFGEEDVTFLETLGDHAAVALENARLYGMLARAAQLHRRLTELVLTEQPIEVLESEIGDALGLRAFVLPGGEGCSPEGSTETEVRAGPVLLGRLCVEADTLGEEHRTALEQAALVVAVHLLKERAVTQAALRTRGELLDAIIAGSMPAEELVRRAAAYGLDLSLPHRAVALRGDQSAALARALPGAFVAGRLGNTVALLGPDEDMPAADVGGCGPALVGPAGVARSVLEATRLLEVAAVLGRTGVVTGGELGIYALLVDADRSEAWEAQARTLLAPLLAYDEAHRSELVRTLEAFLDAQGHATEAAARLYVHVNSLYYRMSRIKELTDWALDDPEQRLQLQLACRILRLARIAAFAKSPS